MKNLFVTLSLLVFTLGCSTKNSEILHGMSSQAMSDLAVATAEPDASLVAARIYAAGGNMADAVVATSFAVSVIRPQSTGLGGGGFLVYYDAKVKQAEAWDFREVAPRKATRTMYVKNGKADTNLSSWGPLSIAVPGLVAGLYDFHRAHGKLSWAQVIQPAIDFAEKGAKVSKHLEAAINEEKNDLEKAPGFSQIFYPNGKALKAGDTFKQPELAVTLRGIAAKGKNYFYTGDFAARIGEWMKKNGGLVTKSDLQNYRAKKRAALDMKWRKYEVISMPPPSSGGVHLLQILKIVDDIPNSYRNSFPEKLADGQSAGKIIAEIEAMKRAFVDRAFMMGDPDFFHVPVKALLDDKYLQRRANEIVRGKIVPAADILPWSKEKMMKETTQMSFIDSEGNAASTTQTINGHFGSGIMVPGTGVIMNDEMDDFSIQPGVANQFGLIGGKANEVQPRKRPLSSMTPTIVLDENRNPNLVLGSPDGSRIITSVYLVTSRILRDGLSPRDALKECRFHDQWMPDKVLVEPACNKKLSPISKLYTLQETPKMGEVQVVGVDAAGKLFSATDPRGAGEPMVMHSDKK